MITDCLIRRLIEISNRREIWNDEDIASLDEIFRIKILNQGKCAKLVESEAASVGLKAKAEKQHNVY